MDERVLRLAAVGLGQWGKNVVRSFAGTARSQLAYLCDSNPRTVEGQQRIYPQAQAVTDYRQVLADGSVEAVVLATPAATHYEMARAALRAGKHVYVEKPLALRTDHAEELVALAAREDRTLMVGHLLEYHPAVEFMKRQIDQGELGKVYYMYCQRLNLGVVRQNENAFWSLAPHDISIILYLFGAEPETVTASGACFLQEGIEDVVFASLHFPDGRLAHIHVSWLDPHKERKMVVVGSEKMLVFDDMSPAEKVRVFDKGATTQLCGTPGNASIGVRHGDIFIPHLSSQQPLDLEAQHFVDCVLNRSVPRSDGRDGLRVVRILEKVERQLRAREAGGFDWMPRHRARAA